MECPECGQQLKESIKRILVERLYGQKKTRRTLRRVFICSDCQKIFYFSFRLVECKSG